MINKYEKDGKVAVLVSSGYGAGWFSWNTEYKEDILFDKDLALAVEVKDFNKAKEIAEEKYPKAYLGGLEDLELEWVEKGTRFFIHEYDGSEALWVIDDNFGYIA